jgi:transcriptional regulator with XRE-family HTH domain
MAGERSLRARVVGAALRRYREMIGYQLEDAARVLDCDRSKISRIESGIRGIRMLELRILLGDDGVDPGEQSVLEVIAGRGWWDEYADVLPAGMGDFLALETAASQLLAYEPQMVPALLQTEPYALDLASADPGLPAGSQHRAAEAVMIRQQAILDQGRLDITAVLGEAALRQAVGGAAVMRAQLGQLAFGEDHPQVTIQVVPFSRGARPASGAGPLAALELAGARPWAWSTSAACPAASTWRTRQPSPATPGCSGTCGRPRCHLASRRG